MLHTPSNWKIIAFSGAARSVISCCGGFAVHRFWNNGTWRVTDDYLYEQSEKKSACSWQATKRAETCVWRLRAACTQRDASANVYLSQKPNGNQFKFISIIWMAEIAACMRASNHKYLTLLAFKTRFKISLREEVTVIVDAISKHSRKFVFNVYIKTWALIRRI